MENEKDTSDKQNKFQWIWLGLISLIVLGSTVVSVLLGSFPEHLIPLLIVLQLLHEKDYHRVNPTFEMQTLLGFLQFLLQPF